MYIEEVFRVELVSHTGLYPAKHRPDHPRETGSGDCPYDTKTHNRK
jgi:hypothetical protein